MLCSAAGLLLVMAACGGDEEPVGGAPEATDTPEPEFEPLDVSSPAFSDGDEIPVRFTCDGESASPPLRWSGVPGDAVETAVLVEDPDAPGGTFVHWMLYSVPMGETALREGEVPAGALQGTNDADVEGYRGPCPPPDDDPHRYRFVVTALGEPSGLEAGAPPEEFHRALEERGTAQGELIGTYER